MDGWIDGWIDGRDIWMKMVQEPEKDSWSQVLGSWGPGFYAITSAPWPIPISFQPMWANKYLILLKLSNWVSVTYSPKSYEYNNTILFSTSKYCLSCWQFSYLEFHSSFNLHSHHPQKVTFWESVSSRRSPLTCSSTLHALTNFPSLQLHQRFP